MSAELENATLRERLAEMTSAFEEQVAALAAEKELAQVTLASIDDGVLTTDRLGRVEFLNAAAERLTGWSLAAARGRPLPEVFRLVDEATGEPVPSLALRCLEDRAVVRRVDRMALERRDGARHAVESTCSPIRDGSRAGDTAEAAGPGAVIGAVLVFQDVSDRRLLSLQIAHQATHDELTGLLNRQAFDQHLERALDAARRHGEPCTLGYMDLDQFKLVNDTCGHLAGDELLRQVTALLQGTLGAEDLLARLGGDEFGVLLPRTKPAAAQARLEVFRSALKDHRYTWREKTFAVAASIGLVPLSDRFESVAHLLSAADHACYVAKEKGRDRLQVYQEADAEFVRRHDEMNWVVRIQQSLERNRFRLFCQQIRPLSPRARRGLHFEVLLRMTDGEGRIHLPSDFIRAAERYGLMRSIDRWVIRNCLRILSAQPPDFLEGLATCAVNLSAVSLGDDEFLGFVETELGRSKVPAGKLCFEITETAAIDNLAQAERLLATLTARGVRFALDDFGTGLSSFAYLKDLPVSVLKIDGRFVQDMVTDPLDRAMVESIHQVGHVMGLETVAEAVGSRAVEERLRTLGVDYAQGNWIAFPVPLEEVCTAGVERSMT